MTLGKRLVRFQTAQKNKKIKPCFRKSGVEQTGKKSVIILLAYSICL